MTVRGQDMYALPFEVFRGQNQPIWVDVYVPKDAAAGVYEGKFRVTARRGEIDPRVANAVGYLSGTLLKALQQGDIAKADALWDIGQREAAARLWKAQAGVGLRTRE